jgi:hypothetical protein
MADESNSNPYFQVKDDGGLAIRVYSSGNHNLAEFPIPDVLDDFGRNYGPEALVSMRGAVEAAIARGEQAA